MNDYPFRKTKNFNDGDFPAETKAFVIDAIQLMAKYIDQYQLRIILPPGIPNYIIKGSTSVIKQDNIGGKMTLLKTYYDEIDDCVYFCIRADIPNHLLTINQDEKAYYLQNPHTKALFICYPCHNLIQINDYILRRVIPFLSDLFS